MRAWRINAGGRLQIFEFALLVFVLAFFIQPPIVFSQNGGAKFEQISNKQGLSDNRVVAIHQDRQGFIWLATAGGLYRYDGYDFINYGHISFYNRSSIYEDKHGSLWFLNGKPGEVIRFDKTSEEFIHYKTTIPYASQIFEDHEGVLWIVSPWWGLSKYYPEADSFFVYKYSPGNAYGLPDIALNVMFEDHNNVFWIGSSDGLYKFDRKKEQFIQWEGEHSGEIFTFHEDNQNQLWIGTSSGLMKMDPLRHSVELFENDSNWGMQVNYIFEDRKGRFWTGNDGMIAQFNLANKKFMYFPSITELHSNVTLANYPIIEDKNGTIWTCINLSLSWFDEDEQKFKIYNELGFPEFVICSLCTDKSGTLWFGTMKDGLFRYDVPSKAFHNIWDKHYSRILNENKLNPSVISLFMDDNDILWVGKPDGLLQIDEKSGTIKLYAQHKNDPISLGFRGVSSIVEESDDFLWLGSYAGGLTKFDKRTGQCARYMHDPDDPGSLIHNEISCLLFDKSGILWAVASPALEKYNPADGTFVHYYDTLSYPDIIAIYEDNFETLWVSTAKGLAVFDRASGSFNYFTNPSSDQKKLINFEANAFCEDKNGNFWVGTGNGLEKLDRKTGTFTHIATGIPNKIIGILEDDHNTLWLLTPRGISNYNPFTGTLKNYDETDGVNLNSAFYFPFCKGKNGVMYFGGFNGLLKFHPDSIRDNPDIPPIVITSLKVFNKEFRSDSIISEKKTIKLSYSENMVAFEFAALNFNQRQKNQYAYMLEGVDKDWYFSGTRRFASYSNLQPGKYVFKVKGSNHDGIWNETGTSVTLLISSPWWKTVWAYLAYGLTVLSVLYGIRRYEMNRLSFKNQVKVDQAILKEKDETDKMKSRFFANISHEFRTPLTLIIGQAERIISDASEDIHKDASTIKRNSNRLLQLINQLLDLSKLEAGKLRPDISKGNIVSTVRGAAMSFESLAASKNIILKIQAEKDNIEMYFDKEKMFQILSNILSNAFKFTHEGGAITVSISVSAPGGHEKSPGHIEIRVRDNGIGIAPGEIPKLFDRFYQVDSSFTREYEGSGIGLALVKEFVELHHGTIRVESKEEETSLSGSGWTEFILSFPHGRDHYKDEDIIQQSEEIISSEPQSDKEIETKILENGNGFFMATPPADKAERITPGIDGELMDDRTIILIVEDNYDMREYIKESLDKSYVIEEAVNGEQGIRRAEKIIPDLIISDMMMPKVDGRELVRVLKNDEKTSHIPIILLTAKAGHEDKLEGLETGADEYLTKPFDHKELQVRIKNLINLRKKLQEKYSVSNKLSFGIKTERLNSIDEKFMLKVGEVIEKHISEEEFNMEDFCSEVAMSRTQLHRKLKALTGKPASLYIRSVKLAKAREMIAGHQGNISEIAYSLGFSSPAYFTRCFREEFGYPPSDLID